MSTWTSHECPNTALFTAAITGFKTLPTEDYGHMFGYGLIAGPGDVSFSEDLCIGHLDNGEYAGPIFYCPWCGVSLRDGGAPKEAA
jgi:hypothetical protein